MLSDKKKSLWTCKYVTIETVCNHDDTNRGQRLIDQKDGAVDAGNKT